MKIIVNYWWLWPILSALAYAGTLVFWSLICASVAYRIYNPRRPPSIDLIIRFRAPQWVMILSVTAVAFGVIFLISLGGNIAAIWHW